MNQVHLNLNQDQFTKIGNAVAENTGTVLNLTKHQFVEKDKASSNTLSIRLTLAQIKRLKNKELIINLTATQCKNIIKDIKKSYGGALPLLALIPLLAKGAAVLGGIGAAAGGVSQVVNAVNNKSHQDKILSETKRHNKELETKGSGVFLGPYKKGSGLYLKPYTG